MAATLPVDKDKGGPWPAFVLLGLWAAFVLAPDTGLLDLKRALGFALAGAAALWLMALAWMKQPLLLPTRRFALACAGLALAYGIAWAASPYAQAGGFRLELLGLGILLALLAACVPEGFAERWPAWALGAALLVALYALLQRAGYEPLRAYALAGSRDRAMGSFGNATFLAAFLCFSWPLALGLHGTRRILAAGLFFVALLATQSRAGVLAVAVQLSVLAWQAWREGLRPRWEALVLITAVGLGFASLLFPWLQWLRPTLRPQVWAQALHLIVQRPWVGWGPGSFPLAFQAQQSAALAASLGATQFVEHPHNWVLSVLHEAGGLGLLAMAFLLAVSQPWPVATARRTPWQRALALGLLGLLVQNLFDRNLDQASLGRCFFFGLGLLDRREAGPQPRLWRPWSGPLLLAVAVVCAWLGLRPLLDYQSAVGPAPTLASAQGDLASLRRAVTENPQDPGAWDRLGTALVAKGAFSEAQDAFNHAYGLQASAGRAINLGNCQLMQDQATAAESSFRAALRLDPRNADAHFSLGYALFYQKRLNEAVAELDAALAIDPEHAGAAKLKEQVLR